MWIAIMHPIYYINPNFFIEIQKLKSFLIQFWMLHKPVFQISIWSNSYISSYVFYSI